MTGRKEAWSHDLRIQHTWPIRDSSEQDQMVTVLAPKDLTVAEAERVAALLRAVALDFGEPS